MSSKLPLQCPCLDTVQLARHSLGRCSNGLVSHSLIEAQPWWHLAVQVAHCLPACSGLVGRVIMLAQQRCNQCFAQSRSLQPVGKALVTNFG